MFRFLTRARSPRRSVAAPRRRLHVERLETRFCPASLAVYVSAMPLPNHIAMVYGGVVGNQGSPTTVTFSGAVSGQVGVNSSGSFTFETNQAVLGLITASAVDANGDSGMNRTMLTLDEPVILWANVTYNRRRNITITGQVQDIDSGLPVVLSGVVNATVTTDAGGNFTYTGDASGLGNVTVSVTDLWGLSAFPDYLTITSQKPVISNLMASWQSTNMYIISGHVADEDPFYLAVQFSGLPALKDVSCPVDANGSFSFDMYIPDSQQGFFYADVTDWWGLAAKEAMGQVLGN
jgi:hypothetical protein